MGRIFVQILVLFMILFAGNVPANEMNDDMPPSFRKGVKAFMDKRSGSKIDEKDKSIMVKAARDLEIAMPEPGLRVGEIAPDFSLINAFGKKVKLSERLKEGPVVLAFYRGAWCPFCNIELNVLQRSLPYFKEYNASLITVTPQQPDKSKEQLEKAEYTFEVLSALDDNVMKSYNLYFEVPQELHELYKNRFNFDITDYNGKSRLGLPVPGTFVIDQDGIIKAAFAQDWKRKNSCIKVDFKEFQKSKDSQLLYTEGVATCTAMTISYPGKFGYLLHITPTDGSYKRIGFLTRMFLRDNYTDFVDRVMKSINRYDILQSEKSLLRFGVVATHDASFKNIVHKLIDNGVELSQIRLLFNKNSHKVDVVFDYENDQMWTLWGGNGFNLMYTDEYEYVPDFGEIIKNLSSYNRA